MINYESYDSLVRKSMVGIESATNELTNRDNVILINTLQGINNELICYSLKEEINKQLLLLKNLYNKSNDTRGYTESILLDSYHSATIEGARTTVENVKKAIKKNKFTKSDQMVYNSMNAFYYAFQHKISLDNIRYLWELVVDGVCENIGKKGTKFRDGMVYISDGMESIHIPQIPEKLEENMVQLFNYLESDKEDPILKAIIFHFYFVYIHPFCDGNGRIVRIIMSSYLVDSGLEKFRSVPISKYINQELSGYYNSLLESEKIRIVNGKKILDITSFIVYMLNVIESSLLSAIVAGNNELSEEEAKIITVMQKKGKGAELTVKKCSNILKITENEALQILNSLTEKGFLYRNHEDKDHYKLSI